MNTLDRFIFLRTHVPHALLLATSLSAVLYFLTLSFWFTSGNPYLFGALLAGEVFHVWQILTYCYTVWDTEYRKEPEKFLVHPKVDVFITVAGEPAEIVRETAQAALAMRYPDFTVHLLNDGLVAKKDNWRAIEDLAWELGIDCITRTKAGGAKAGNINHALGKTEAPLIAIFDADQVPHPDFLEKTANYFTDPSVGFVQSPQFYKNATLNRVTRGAWEQQLLFFGPLCKGKNRLNSVFMCGTNMLIRRTALVEAGGMCETNIAEDFLTSLFIHKSGWQSVYAPEVLAEGLAPEDFLSYYKQQFRWARGSLEVVFSYNPLFQKGLSWPQKIQYLASATYYLSGPIVLMNAVLPLIFFFSGLVPFNTSTMALASAFLPYIGLVLYTIRASSNFSYSFEALAFSVSSFMIHLQALWAVLTAQKTGFSITAKTQTRGNFSFLAIPQISYLFLVLAGLDLAVQREGISPSLLTNASWALLNVGFFLPFILAAFSFEPAPAARPLTLALAKKKIHGY